MTDPAYLIAYGAIIGSAASKFTELAWDSGQKWLETYFANHSKKVTEKAKENSADFLNNLAKKISLLEEQQRVTKETIETAQDHPDFSVLLQRAMLASAQVDSKDTHEILARLVAERLRVNPDSTLAVVTKLACDAIPNLTTKQLHVLGLVAQLRYIKWGKQLGLDANSATEALISRLNPYQDFKYGTSDILQLEATSCLKHHRFIETDLNKVIMETNEGIFSWDIFIKSKIGQHVVSLWNNPIMGLKETDLTSTGILIGIYVSDLFTKSRTELNEFNF